MTNKIYTDDILEALSEVVDPEVNIPIIEMGDPEKEPNGLIDEVNIDKNNSVEVKYHATTPYCPPIFALQISMDIKQKVEDVEMVKDVTVIVSGHALSSQINEKVNAKKN